MSHDRDDPALEAAFHGPREVIKTPCPVCDSSVGLWLCGDGETIILMCEECTSKWLSPEQVYAETRLPFYGGNPPVVPDTDTPILKSHVSRWATWDEVVERGWDEFLRDWEMPPKA